MLRLGQQVAELLIGAGADVRAKNGRGEMPMDLTQNELVLALLLSAAQELDKRDEEEVRRWSNGTSSFDNSRFAGVTFDLQSPPAKFARYDFETIGEIFCSIQRRTIWSTFKARCEHTSLLALAAQRSDVSFCVKFARCVMSACMRDLI